MKYIEGSLKPGKPYRQRKMTHSNCAIDISRQAVMYAEWAHENWPTEIHAYRPSRSRHQKEFMDALVGQLDPMVSLKLVDPEDWK